MKFTGLILICASFSLALILPAIGVVQFPRIVRSAPASTFPTSVSTSAVPIATSQPEHANGTGWSPASRPLGNYESILPSSPFPPSMQTQPTNESQRPSMQQIKSMAQDDNPAASKLGMGIWLLLGPVSLFGLALWTFSPNPSGTKSRT